VASTSPLARHRTAHLQYGTSPRVFGAVLPSHVSRRAKASRVSALLRSTRLRSGMAGARLLRWSPLGNYLLVAGFDQRGFEIWETHTW